MSSILPSQLCPRFLTISGLKAALAGARFEAKMMTYILLAAMQWLTTACSDAPTATVPEDLAMISETRTLSSAGLETVWDARLDFSTLDNPNGAWSYGWSSGAPLYTWNIYSTSTTHNVLEKWAEPLADSFGGVYRNPTSATAFGLTSGAVAIHPSCSGLRFIGVRWTAPAPGDYRVRVTFFVGEGGFVQVGILHPDAPNRVVFDGWRTTEALTWEGTLSFVAAGDPLDVITHNGDGCERDITPVDISIEPVADANSAPIVTAIALPADPVALGSPASITATFTDLDLSDNHTSLVNWGDGSSSPGIAGDGVVSAGHTYGQAGVYKVNVSVDDGQASGERNSEADVPAYIVIYDPSGGFVTGGGWINSPAGAYAADHALSGKANFGFVSKYQKGATVPSGNTHFQFQAAGFEFKSTSYDWLVIAGARAQYKGSGTVNGTGAYSFMLTAIDGQVSGGGGGDKLRFKVWDAASSAIIYDNELAAAEDADPITTLGGGSITIHQAK